MDFVEALPVTFKEIAPNHYIPEKWREIVLNTGGTHSTLQDIKLPQKAGGYWYEDSDKTNTRNRFIYWQTTADSIELSEASMDVNLSSANLRCKVAPGTPPLNGMSVWERPNRKELIILAATVSSVHRLVFPHPQALDKKVTFGSLNTSSLSVFHDTSLINNSNNYYLLNQYSNTNSGVAHTCSTYLKENGEAVYVLAFAQGGEGTLLVVKMPIAGNSTCQLLKKESAIPRFLSGITGALRGKQEQIQVSGIVCLGRYAVTVCQDSCVRAWSLDEPSAPAAVTLPLSANTMRPKPMPHGHMVQKAIGPNGVILVVFLSFPNECEFVVLKMHDNGAGAVKFSQTCKIFGPQLDLLDFTIGFGDGNHVIWALWSQPDGETLITTSSVGPEPRWQGVSGAPPLPPLPPLSSHPHYRDHVLAPALFPAPVLRKALTIYRRTWGGGDSNIDTDLGEAASNAVLNRVRLLSARTPEPDHAHVMHKCWSDLYSWCVQYMEGLQKPLGLMVSKQTDSGWWCAVVRRAGISLVREMEPLERMMLADTDDWEDDADVKCGSLSADAVRIVRAGAAFSRALGEGGGGDLLERQLFSCLAPQHRLLPRLLRLLLCPPNHHHPMLTPQQIDELTSMLQPIKDLQEAVLELNEVLRLDVPDIITDKDSLPDCSDYDSLFSSDLGIAIVTESISQMAEMRGRVVRGCVGAAAAARGADGVPGAGHCVVHWQAYRALLWLRRQSLAPRSPSTSDELFRLKLSALGIQCGSVVPGVSGVVPAYSGGAGGGRARTHLRAAGAPLAAHRALPLLTYHLAHQLWAVSGSFDFGLWLASINQPKLVQNYVALLEPWCEWNACSRQFILGLALLDMNDPESAYTAFCKAAKGVSTEPFLRDLVNTHQTPSTQHQALVLYYMKVIKLFEIHDAGACVVRLAETAISIADKDDPNLSMFQWLVFKWHLASGQVERALNAAAANPAPHARASAAATLLTTLASRKQLGALVGCTALWAEAERAALSRASLHDAHTNNPYYDFLYALYINRQHYRQAASIMYERAYRCRSERSVGAGGAGSAGGAGWRRALLATSLSCLLLADPRHAFIVVPGEHRVIGPEELKKELRESDPDSVGIVQQLLLSNENIDFDRLYPKLKDADVETLLAVLRRVITTGQFLPEWFLLRFIQVDSNACIRSLVSGGRAECAASVCVRVLRHALVALPGTSPLHTPLLAVDMLLTELRAHNIVNEELENLVKEYKEVVTRTSEDIRAANLNVSVCN